MQLFLSIEKNLEIGVEDNKISCRCIVINCGILHSFSTGNKMYFLRLNLKYQKIFSMEQPQVSLRQKTFKTEVQNLQITVIKEPDAQTQS